MHFFGDIAFTTLALMVFAALCAGFIDAIAGGGGLIQLPAMLIGLPNSPTVQVLGTNKLSSIFGTSVAAHLYRRNIKPDFRITVAMAFPAFLGSMLGAQLASHIPTQALRPLVFILLVGVAIFTWFKPDLGTIESLRHTARKSRIIASVAGAGLGFYDGIFGPGTGTFFILALVALVGFDFLTASSIAKVTNVATNVGAILIFGLHGVVLWKVGFMMGAANILGAIMGAKTAIAGGATLVRKVFLFVTIVLIFKVGIDTISHW